MSVLKLLKALGLLEFFLYKIHDSNERQVLYL